MKKKRPTQKESNIVASVEAEMEKPRLTESVRSELEDPEKKTPTEQK